MNIHWLAPYQIQGQIQRIEQFDSLQMASVRLHAGALLSVLDSSKFTFTLGTAVPDDAAVMVVGKMGGREIVAPVVDQIERHKAHGGRVILDYTDDHLAVETALTPFYRACVSYADMCVCSSRQLKESLEHNFRGRIQVIPDAIEIDSRPPKGISHNPVTLLWFGHNTNLSYLVDFLPSLAADRTLNLIILTNTYGIQWLQSSGVSVPTNLNIQGGIWDKSAMEKAASASDICIIPSDPDDPRKAGVSSNRLVTALALGLPTGADLMGSYVDRRRYFADIRSKEFQEMLTNPIAWHDRILGAQREIVPLYTMASIGKLWLNAICAES